MGIPKPHGDVRGGAAVSHQFIVCYQYYRLQRVHGTGNQPDIYLFGQGHVIYGGADDHILRHRGAGIGSGISAVTLVGHTVQLSGGCAELHTVPAQPKQFTLGVAHTDCHQHSR